MVRLFVFAFLVFAGWYAWHHWHDLTDRRARHEAIIENRSGRTIERVRLAVGGQTFVKESIPDESSATFPFLVNEDASFVLEWKWPAQDLDQRWTGGLVPRGPMVQRHYLTVDGEGAILYRAEHKLGP
jgi:hypothetical protein